MYDVGIKNHGILFIAMMAYSVFFCGEGTSQGLPTALDWLSYFVSVNLVRLLMWMFNS